MAPATPAPVSVSPREHVCPVMAAPVETLLSSAGWIEDSALQTRSGHPQRIERPPRFVV
jgi:hypothetical protein